MNTNPFQRLCKSIDAKRFLDLVKTAPITIPRKMSGSILCALKCARANTTELTRIEHQTGMYLVKEGSRNPRNTISSHIGAHIATTIAYSTIATGSLATIDCSTLETVIGEDCRWGTRLRLTCDNRLTRGNMRHPRPTSNCQFPLRLNLNQSAGRVWNLERQRWRMAIPAKPSATSVNRLYRAWPLYVRDSLLNPAAWAKNGTIQDPTNQKEAIQSSITCNHKRIF
ncbi:hypothetical protein FRX31_012645 [Thalictrum thalictroides]|uniref:Uncharacterized protein n=1 Tax=Thalictrum thalictroides TaxID=46969 RepID=A0A7J6WLC1_THATH|nr:hypothetical protein FRX31_012645 [Thalictrum thalictroides]